MDVQIEKLLRLQQIDGRMAELTDAITRLPQRLEALEANLQAQKQAFEQAQKAVLAEEAKRRRLESDLKDQQQKLLKYRDQSNSVKTNDQFRALQHEIGFVEAEIRRIEDVELTSMVESETLESNRARARGEIASQSESIDREKSAARADSSLKSKELEDLRKERAGLRSMLDSGLLAQYDRLASSSRKTALARASGQRCLACQMAMRPQFWNMVRAGTLLNCESCGRLLYFDSGLELPPAESAHGLA